MFSVTSLICNLCYIETTYNYIPVSYNNIAILIYET